MILIRLFILFILISIGVISCQRQDTYATNNAVASAHPLASEAAMKIFDLGGNAADAAIAAAFTLAVVEPSMSGIGGRLQAIVHEPLKGISGIDASTQVPQNYDGNSNESEGYKTIGIPGVVAGLMKLHRDHGSMPLKSIMKPAISLAENGFTILPGEAYRQKLARASLLNYKGSRELFLKGDSTSHEAGDTFIQPELAKVLKSIAEKGHDGFYKGEIADEIVKDFNENGGYLTQEDLFGYEAKESIILKGAYKGRDVYSLYLPSYGAITINMLQILDHFDLNSADTLSEMLITAKVISKAYQKRAFQSDSLDHILSYDLAKKEAEEIKNEIRFMNALYEKDPISYRAKQGHTTHLTTADKNGLVISLTQTIGPNMGSKVATNSLGFLYAVTMGGYLGDYQPGDRANSHISPTLVMNDGALELALGAAGGSRIVTAITQTIKNAIDLELPLNAAVSRGRVYPLQDTLLIESHPGININSLVLDTLKSIGIPYKLQETPGFHGRINAIQFDRLNNRWIGVSDPDWEGIALYDN